MNTSILVVEDDYDIREILETFLVDSGYKVITASDGLEGLQRFREKEFDLLIIDVMMPKIDGFVLCEMIREESKVPIIILTALDDEKKQIKGFDLQIDDYITKPFSTILLLKRVENILRRVGKGGTLEKKIIYKEIEIDTERINVRVNNSLIELTQKEYELLLMLIKNKGKTQQRSILLNELWGYNYVGESRVVDTHIKNLRKKLQVDYIETVRGVGYRID